MKKKIFGEIFFGIILGLYLITPSAAQTAVVSTEEEITADVKSVVCKNDERLDSVKSLFKKMGATDEEITVENLKTRKIWSSSKKGKPTKKSSSAHITTKPKTAAACLIIGRESS